MAEPSIFGLPPGVDFAARVLDALPTRLDLGDPLAMGRVRIIVNTERAARRFAAVQAAGPAGVSPQITVLSALVGQVPDLPDETPALALRLELAQLVRALLDADPTAGARGSAYPLADTLAGLLAEMRIEGAGFAALDGLDLADRAGHLARARSFLGVIRDLIEGQDGGPTDKDHRLALALERLAARWAEAPPDGPVIVAGSTGSRGATAGFMAGVARLDQGYVVLPGVDPDLPGDVWDVLTDAAGPVDHPQAMIARFCARARVSPVNLPVWDTRPAPAPLRGKLVSLALRPAPVTDQWLRDGEKLKAQLATALQDVTLLEADDLAEEALAIAVALRRALAEGKTAALITPDRVLARRVTAALGRWDIRPDDSAGRPLALTPPGIHLRLTAPMLAAAPDPVALVALLKHPLTGGAGPARGAHLRCTAALELLLRQQGGPQISSRELHNWATATHDDDLAEWLIWLADLMPEPMRGEAALGDLLTRHRSLAEALSAGRAGRDTGALWDASAGARAAEVWQALSEASPAAGPVPLAEYPVLLQAILSREEVPEEAFVPTPGIAIWGTLEARTQAADLVILGGLTEGRWPDLPQPDPWLSRKMRAEMGLTLPERQIGLSAHDFQQAAAARQVILSSPRRDGEAPSVPARWVFRLTNLVGGLGTEGVDALASARARGAEVLRLARSLDQPQRPVPQATRPAPVPPAADFPAQLSVTRIETLVRDPYAVYADRILNLKPLDPLLRSADARERGTLTHLVLERFVAATLRGLPEPAEARAIYERIVEEALAQVPWPSARVFWRARLMAFAPWFLESEAERRALAPPAGLELRGRVPVEGLSRPFTLSATADRVDAAPDGRVLIHDYKGALPSKAERQRFYPQLPLEAGIALRGGFEGIPSRAVEALSIIETKPPGSAVLLEGGPEEWAEVWEAFRTLIATYQAGGQAYPARARKPSSRFEGDYDHLSRYGEWVDADPAVPEVVG